MAALIASEKTDNYWVICILYDEAIFESTLTHIGIQYEQQGWAYTPLGWVSSIKYIVNKTVKGNILTLIPQGLPGNHTQVFLIG